VRHPEYEDFLEEDWLYEAITETYIPLLQMMEGLERDGIRWRLTMSLTPTLCSMLADPLLKTRYQRHLEELIELAHKEVDVTIYGRANIKRTPLSTYRSQGRGGVGIIGAKTKDDDDIRHLIVSDTHDKLIFFTDRGRCFQVKTYEVDEGKREARGISIMQLLMLDQKERITAVVRVSPTVNAETDFMVMATQLGEIKKTPMKNFANVRRDGLIAMDLEASDEFVSAHICTDADDAIMISAKGQAIRFAAKTLRSASRLSGGVRGMKLRDKDKVVGMVIAEQGLDMLVVSRLGHGKRTPVDDYPKHGRGGQGVITFKTHDKSGDLVTARMVDPEHELIMVSEGGIILRTPVKHISQQGRPTQGVKLMNVGDDDKVAAVAVIDMRKEYDSQPLPTGASDTNGDGIEVKQKGTRGVNPNGSSANGRKK
ncbi:MAG: DNA gyrase C-terminal beta-propeller domain-containing protein, partial [Chloroflexota bacterium]